MTSHLNSHGTNDIKPEMLSGVQTGNGIPHDKYNIRGIARVHKQKRRHFNAKTTSAKLYIYIREGQGTCSLTKHTWHWTYSACCLVRFVAFLRKTPLILKSIVKIFGPNNAPIAPRRM